MKIDLPEAGKLPMTPTELCDLAVRAGLALKAMQDAKNTFDSQVTQTRTEVGNRYSSSAFAGMSQAQRQKVADTETAGRVMDARKAATIVQKSSKWIAWRCPPDHFQWFKKPIPLDAATLFPPTEGQKPAEIIKMFSAYMPILPDQALAIVWHSVDRSSLVIEWLTSGIFDDLPIARKTKSYGKPVPILGPLNNGSAPSAQDPYVRYIKNRELIVSPRHHDLQKRFKSHIVSKGAKSIKSDQNCIDLQFEMNGSGIILVEIKPCDKSDARYAIRTAMGQLLDYKQRHASKHTKLMIVVEVKPIPEDIGLAIENGFGIAYPRGTGFALKWR